MHHVWTVLLTAPLLIRGTVAASARPTPPGPSIHPAAFSSAQACSACHKDIHAGWSASVHARSYSDPIFREALGKISPAPGQEKDPRTLCLSCHAPTTILTKDFSGSDSLTREGITCSFCHSITAAKAAWSPDAFTIEPGRIMRGPFQFVSSPGHETQYSPLHRTALLCAPCHQFTAASGVAVLNTYEEWKAGPWPSRGVQCQDCHMALVRGAVADTILRPAQISAQDRRLINLHRLVGGSALGQLRRALTARVRETRRENGSITLLVDVTNDAAGHRAPTGLPSRSIVLTLEATSDGKRFHSEERVYGREIYDDSGKRILLDSDAFLRAARTGRDTRLVPGETRLERFTFAAPPGSVQIVLALDYVVAGGGGGAQGVPGRRDRFQELKVEAR